MCQLDQREDLIRPLYGQRHEFGALFRRQYAPQIYLYCVRTRVRPRPSSRGTATCTQRGPSHLERLTESGYVTFDNVHKTTVGRRQGLSRR